MIGLGLVIKLTRLPDVDDENANTSNSERGQAKSSLFKHKHLVLGAMAIFCGVGEKYW